MAKISKRHIVLLLRIIAVFVTITAVTCVILWLLLKNNQNILKFYFSATESSIEADVNKEKAELLGRAKELAADPTLRKYIGQNDILTTLNVLNSEQQKSLEDFFVAINAQGRAMSDTANNIRGDYAFKTLVHGRLVAAGQAVVSAEKSYINRLILVGAAPILEGAKVVGGIFAGYDLEKNTFVNAFRQKYFADDTQLAVYDKEKGVISYTFSDEATAGLVKHYFNSASDWVQQQRSQEFVDILGKFYFVDNIPFSGVDETEGGLLVFMPVKIWPYYIPVAVVALFSSWLAYVIGRKLWRQQTSLNLLALVGLAFILITILHIIFTELMLKGVALEVKEQPFVIYNSLMRLEPEGGILAKDVYAQVAVKVSTGGEAINAAQITLTYDPSIVRVEDIITANSFCDPSMFLEKNIDNDKGEVNISCLTTKPFTKENGTVVELLINPIKEGDFALQFADKTQILANDGLGTNVLRIATNGSYKVAATDKSSSELLIFSSTHPNGEKWYSLRKINLTWHANGGRESYFYAFNERPNYLAGAQDKATASENVYLEPAADGIYFFHLTAVGTKLTRSSSYKIKIDTTPPEDFSVKASNLKINEGEIVRFEFSAKDKMSGLQKYFYAKIDNNDFFPALSPLHISFPEGGRHSVTFRVFDQANNFRDKTINIDVAGDWFLGR